MMKFLAVVVICSSCLATQSTAAANNPSEGAFSRSFVMPMTSTKPKNSSPSATLWIQALKKFYTMSGKRIWILFSVCRLNF